LSAAALEASTGAAATVLRLRTWAKRARAMRWETIFEDFCTERLEKSSYVRFESLKMSEIRRRVRGYQSRFN
jgi:hypothetical protein